MKSSNVIREIINNGSISSYTKIGKKKKPRNIEDLRYGETTTDIKEIELCLNCPYPDCVDKCKRMRDFRRIKK